MKQHEYRCHDRRNPGIQNGVQGGDNMNSSSISWFLLIWTFLTHEYCDAATQNSQLEARKSIWCPR